MCFTTLSYAVQLPIDGDNHIAQPFIVLMRAPFVLFLLCPLLQSSNGAIDCNDIIENEEKLYFDFKNDLLTDYDIISTNQENKFDFFQLD